MFKGLKNKIREETGSDVSKINPHIGVTSQKTSTFKGRHSRQGSTSSIGSFSTDGIREENSQSPISIDHDLIQEDTKVVSQKDMKLIDKREEEWKKKLNKLEMEWKRKLEEKEKEMIKQLEATEEDKLKREKSISELEKALLLAEEFKDKYCRYQEEKEQLEGFQTQEMAKIKHLLLAKERELSEKLLTLKESNTQIASLKSEVNRLRRFEEEISNIQDEMESLRHSSEQERATLRSELAQSEETVRHLRDRVAVLERRTSADCMALGAPLSIDERIQGLLGERTLLERRLEEAHLHLADIKSSWSSKITSLETQVGRLCRQAAEEGSERRRAETECALLEERVQQLEVELANASENAAEKNSMALEMERLRSDLDGLANEKDDVSGKLKNVQTSLEAQVKILQQELNLEQEKIMQLQAASDIQVEKLKKEIFDLEKSMKSNVETSQSEISQLKHELENERIKSANMLATIERERNEKEAEALKSAKISEQVTLSSQSLKAMDEEIIELKSQIEALQCANVSKNEKLNKAEQQNEETMALVQELQREKELHLAASNEEKDLRETISELEMQVLEKNKNIKQLQQRLGDMKKTLQRELNLQPGSYGADLGSNGTTSSGSASEDTSGTAAVLAPSSSHHVSQRHLQLQAGATSSQDHLSDVNFQYLKHVLMKFLTSREYEAKHLTRAVATLLHFSPEEERLLRETLEWKMSWFGSRPSLGFGQTAKTIPPS